MRRVRVQIKEIKSCWNCGFSQCMDSVGYCHHEKSVGEVSQYLGPDRGCHPDCPLLSLPEGFDAQQYVEGVLRDANSREIRLIKT